MKRTTTPFSSNKTHTTTTTTTSQSGSRSSFSSSSSFSSIRKAMMMWLASSSNSKKLGFLFWGLVGTVLFKNLLMDHRFVKHYLDSIQRHEHYRNLTQDFDRRAMSLEHEEPLSFLHYNVTIDINDDAAIVTILEEEKEKEEERKRQEQEAKWKAMKEETKKKKKKKKTKDNDDDDDKRSAAAAKKKKVEKSTTTTTTTTSTATTTTTEKKKKKKEEEKEERKKKTSETETKEKKKKKKKTTTKTTTKHDVVVMIPPETLPPILINNTAPPRGTLLVNYSIATATIIDNTTTTDSSTSSISLVTHLRSLDQWPLLLNLANKYWKDSFITCAIYVANAAEKAQLDMLSKNKPSTLSLHVFQDDFFHTDQTQFPINRLRNLALDHAMTDYVLLLDDIHFIPSYNAFPILKQTLRWPAHNSWGERMKQEKQLLVLPAFESNVGTTKKKTTTTKTSKLPLTKDELLISIHNNHSYPYNSNGNVGIQNNDNDNNNNNNNNDGQSSSQLILQGPHGPTNYEKWYTSLHQLYQVQVPPLQNLDDYQYEPYVLAYRGSGSGGSSSLLPRFWEALDDDCPQSRASWFLELAFQNYQYNVVPNAFVIRKNEGTIHKQPISSTSTTSTTNSSTSMIEFKERFVPYLMQTYKRRTPRDTITIKSYNNAPSNTTILRKHSMALRPPKANQISIVTQLDLDHWSNLIQLANQWKGYITCAILVRGAKELQQLQEKIFNQQPPKVSIHVLLDNSPDDADADTRPYPINILRNLALDNTETDYVLLTEVDFLPSNDALAQLRKIVLSSRQIQQNLRQDQHVLVLPAFESFLVEDDNHNNNTTTTTTTTTTPPLTKPELLQSIHAGTSRPYHMTDKKIREQTGGHGYTNYLKWYNISSDSELYEVQTKDPSSNNLFMYYWEPHIVAYRKGLPRFWDGFVGFGKNKASWFLELDFMGYKYDVVPQTFVIYPNNHTVKEGTKKKKQKISKAVVEEFKYRFAPYLREKYNKDMPRDVAVVAKESNQNKSDDNDDKGKTTTTTTSTTTAAAATTTTAAAAAAAAAQGVARMENEVSPTTQEDEEKKSIDMITNSSNINHNDTATIRSNNNTNTNVTVEKIQPQVVERMEKEVNATTKQEEEKKVIDIKTSNNNTNQNDTISRSSNSSSNNTNTSVTVEQEDQQVVARMEKEETPTTKEEEEKKSIDMKTSNNKINQNHTTISSSNNNNNNNNTLTVEEVQQHRRGTILTNYSMASPEPFENTTTLVTQLTIDQWSDLKALAEQWQGYITCAIYVKNENERKELDTLIQGSNKPEKLTIHVFQDDSEEAEEGKRRLYPTNRMRNLALDNTYTDFVFLVEVDLVLSNNLLQVLEDAKMNSWGRRLAEDRQVLVIPTFELLKNDTSLSPPPLTKEELVASVKRDETRPYGLNEFEIKAKIGAHGPTHYEKWYTMTQEIYHIETPPLRNLIDYHYEPYILAHRKGLPRFWDGFEGNEATRATWFLELAFRRYEFNVLPNAFVIHKKGDNTQQDKGKFINEQKMPSDIKEEFEERFTPYLVERYKRRRPSDQITIESSGLTANTTVLVRHSMAMQPPKANQISIVTQLDVKRWPNLMHLSHQWKGYITCAIYVKGDEEMNELNQLIKKEQPPKVSIHVLRDDSGDKKRPYPINIMRNLALDNTDTDFVFLIDVDFLPSNDALPQLRKILLGNSHMQTKLRDKHVLVLPAFEFFNNPNTTIPLTKRELMASIQAKASRPFHMTEKQVREKGGGHGFTDFEKWYKVAPDEIYEIKTQNPPYLFKYYFEPYVVAYRKGLPRFWDGFVGFGKNKATWFLELDFMGYKYDVVPQTFVIHKNHVYSDIVGKRTKRLSSAALGEEFQERFAPYLRDKYKKSMPHS